MAHKGVAVGIAGLVLSASAVAHVASASSSESASARANRPQVTTLQTIRGRIGAFAQDESYVAWVSGRGVVVVRRLGTSAQRAFRDPDISSGLVLDGPRVFWVDRYCGNPCYSSLVSARLGDRGDAWWRRARQIDEEATEGGWGNEISDFGADRGTRLFGTLRFGSCYGPNERDAGTYGGDVVGGTIERVVGRTHSTLLEFPASTLAVSAGRVAAVRVSDCLGNNNPAWSPDGSLIAFTHSGAAGPDKAAELSIDVVSSTGAGRRTVVRNGWGPAWAPDGSSLAFVTGSGRGGSIAIANADGTGVRTILSCSDPCRSPAWAPHASKLVFERHGDLFTVKADGSGETQLTQTPSKYESEPAWSPDGRSIVFTRMVGNRTSVITIDAGGGNARRLADGRWPSYSPDGRTIAFVKHPGFSAAEIYVMRANGTAVRRLTHDLRSEETPEWSPDGRRLAFASDGDLYLMNPDGSAKTGVTDDRLPIEVHSLSDGALLSRFLPRGAVLAMALTPKVAAVLAEGWSERVIVLFDPVSGASRGVVQVPHSVSSISAATRTVVFAAGRRIWALDTRSLRRRLLAVAASRPIGLSIEGRRVAWAESGKQRSHIRAASLP